MMTPDEPILGPDFDPSCDPISAEPDVGESIRRLMASQPFGVLCAQGWGQPYGAVVAFAYDPEVSALAFSTAVATRKFRLLEESSHVALVIDSRSVHPEDVMKVEAVTVTGLAVLLAEPEARRDWARRIGERHAYLREFLKSPSTAVFRVNVLRCFYVTRFQEVTQWVPPRIG
jgi:nitroimidazol reductase NimA-like FMN-containing flavoprotein (pyridoxamine 5'-phosphate oxidase superfamily)